MQDEPTLPYLPKPKVERDASEGSIRLEVGPQSLFELSPVPMAVSDLETGRILGANSALCEFVRRDAAELIGKPHGILYPEKRRSSRSQASLRFQRAQRSAVANKEIVTLHGSMHEVEVRAALVDCQGRKGLLRIFLDVSDDRNLERKVSAMADAVSSAVGRKLFVGCAVALAEAADADGVIVAAFDHLQHRVNVLASAPPELMKRGHPLDGLKPPWLGLSQGKPCELSSRDPVEPIDKTLLGLGTQVLLGIPLRDAKQRVMGCLVVLYKSAIRRKGFALSASRIMAARVGAELERLRDEPSDLELAGRYRVVQEGHTPRPSVKPRRHD
jgi:PAS domain S-box-containing protein